MPMGEEELTGNQFYGPNIMELKLHVNRTRDG